MFNHLPSIKKKKVLITGGLGFVGNNLARTLVNEYECDVIIVDNCANSTIHSIDDIADRVRVHQFSVLETGKLFPLIKGIDYLFHLACMTINTSGTNPIEDLKVNGESTLRILNYLKENQDPVFKRFIYTSSCSVYGSSSRLPVSEQDGTPVLSNYAATKLLGEQYTIIYNRNYNIPVSVVRYSNVYGYGQSPRNPYCGVLGKFIHNAITGQSLSIFGDGEQTRDYTFITDAVEATILSAVHPMALGDVFNVGTGVETSVNRLAEMINELVPVPGSEINHVPERDIDNIRRRVIDIEKIHQRLGWVPKIGIQKGLSLTTDWYKTIL